MTHTHPVTKLPKTRASHYAGSVQTESAERADSEPFLRREVLPSSPDAWYDPVSIKVGYEINFNRYFYKPKALRTLEQIRADLLAVEREAEGLLEEIFGSARLMALDIKRWFEVLG
jgi:type I restriction enzyme M protein